MTSPQEQIARNLDAFGTLGQDIFVDYSPTTPQCITVQAYSGGEGVFALGAKAMYRSTSIQVKVRNPSQATAMSTASSIVDLLDGFVSTNPLTSPSLVSVFVTSGPIFIGRDKNNNSEYTINLKVTWR